MYFIQILTSMSILHIYNGWNFKKFSGGFAPGGGGLQPLPSPPDPTVQT